MCRMVRVLGTVLALATTDGEPARAHGHGHSHGGGHGHSHHGHHHHPLLFGAVPFYAPRPIYYYPADVTVTTTLNLSAQPGECRPFQGDAVVDATGEPFYGTACFGPDFRWHVAR